MPQEHHLKTWPDYFDAIARGEKNFEVRRDDRGFQRGDYLILFRTEIERRHIIDRDSHGAPKHTLKKQITYVLTGGQFGIEPGYVVMGLSDAL